MMRLLAALLLALPSPTPGPPIPSPTPPAAGSPCPTVVAHATARLLAPENTVPGIEAAGAAGADMVEMDVQWSSSGFPVLMHDLTVDRTTDGTGPVATLGLGQLRALNAAAYPPWIPRVVPVPYGPEFMGAAAVAGLDVLLDIHAVPTADGADRLGIYIDRAAWRDRTLIMGTPTQLAVLRARRPDLTYLLIEYPPVNAIRSGPYLADLGVAGYTVVQSGITGPAVTYWKASAPGLKVFTWSSDTAVQDTPTVWAGVTAAGVDAIITDQPAGLRAWQATGCGPDRVEAP